MRRAWALLPVAVLGSCAVERAAEPAAAARALDPVARCAALMRGGGVAWPDPATRLVSADYRPAGEGPPPPMAPPGTSRPMLPAHCDITAAMHERTGRDGQKYAIRFHVRLPDAWNGRFLFQGGSGTNGDIGDAVGQVGMSEPPALGQGYAVVSQDSGHDNHINSNPARGGMTAFGYDAQARADYGGTSLKPVTEAARALVAGYYGRMPDHSYFFGCSKGGQEGMMLAQRYPELFDGIVANAPGFALPRAAVAEAWDTQSFAAVVAKGGQSVTPALLAASFSDADLKLVGDAVLKACDADDGVADAIVGAYGQCTSDKVLPELAHATCTGAKTAACLSSDQVTALRRTHDGAHDSHGRALYAEFPWDAGWSSFGWRLWKIGGADGRIPPLNVMMGMPALSTVFTTPPQAPAPGLPGSLAYALAFDFDRDAPRVDAAGPGFPRSAWQDIAAHSPDLSGFRRRGGRLIVAQGVSDPVFSIEDTLGWYRRVDARNGGRTASFARVFPVPGMAHCGGGPATDGFDALGALVRWVEDKSPPETLIARAGRESPWPGRTRPLCRYPLTAQYRGSGDVERAESFTCRAPGRSGR